MVTHVHGAHVNDDSDGYPETWYLPAAADIPAGYATEGTWYDTFRRWPCAARRDLGAGHGRLSTTGMISAATTLWYHDHAWV